MKSSTTISATPLIEHLPHLSANEAPAWLSATAMPVRPLFFAEDLQTHEVHSPVAPQPSVESRPASVPPSAQQKAEIERLYSEARTKGAQDGLVAAQHKVQEILDRYAGGLAELAAFQRRVSSVHAEDVVTLAMVVAREILGRELLVDRNVIAMTLKEALEKLGPQGPVVVRLGATDAAYLRRCHPEVLNDIEVVEDPNLGIGGCVVESPHHTIEASIESRLDGIAKQLHDALMLEHHTGDTVHTAHTASGSAGGSP